MAIFMKVPFTSGSVTSAGFDSWIELTSMQLGTNRSLSAETATLQHRKHGVTVFSAFTVTKEMDESSPGLIGEAWHGTTGHDIDIVVAEQGPQPKEYVRYKLKKAMLDSYTVGSNGEEPTETFSFTFAHIEIKYTPRDDANRSDTPDRVAYDLSKNEKA